MILACNFLCVCVCGGGVSLSGFGIRLMVASLNEFGNILSSAIFEIVSEGEALTLV